ncbi:MAG: TauD/TfdA family dioxygenase [Pseudomonadota bacterium]
MALEFKPIDGSFGVVGPDIDLAGIDDATFLDIKAAVRREALLLFRRQSMTDAELDAFSARFGKVEVPAAHDALSPTTRHVVYISNMKGEDGTALGGGGSSEMNWHADQAFRANPATLSLLYGVIIPPKGGHTYFCNTRMGYEALPDTLKSRAKVLKGTYLPGPNHKIEKVEVAHDLVMTKPDDGNHVLYVSKSTRGVEGLPETEAQEFLEELLSYQLRPEHVYEHDWRPGDLLIYDNGQTLHRRDSFEGLRFMKGTRAFVSPEEFAVPS